MHQADATFIAAVQFIHNFPLFFNQLQLADGHLIGNPFFKLVLPDFFQILTTLHSAPDFAALSHVEAAGETGVASPADTGDIIGFSVRPVYGQEHVGNFPSQRSLSVNRFLADIAVQINLIGFGAG